MALDWLYASYLAASNELVTYSMGGNWYIVSYYVPLIGVVHVLIFLRLMKGDPRKWKEKIFPRQARGILLTNFLTVQDVGRARAFYSDVLGGKVVRDIDPCIIRLANTWITISVGGGAKRQAWIWPGDISSMKPSSEGKAFEEHYCATEQEALDWVMA